MDNKVNIRNFLITVRSSAAFQFALDNFSKTTNWFITFVQTIVMTANLLIIRRGTSTINLGIIRNIYDTVKLRASVTSTILNGIVIDAVASLSYKISSTINITHVLTAVMKFLSYAESTFNNKRIKMVLTMVTAALNYLGDFDGDTLGTMDVETLGDLDYTVV